MRGAQCNTDHQMLRVKLHVGPVRQHYRPNSSSQMRFDISKLKEQAVGSHGRTTATGHFQEMVEEKLNQLWEEADSIEKKWTSVKSALCEAAEATIGREKRRQADWFRESAPTIRPLVQKRNALYNKWLSSGKVSDKEEFQEARKKTQKAIREAKNNWFSLKAKEAQGGVNGGKVVCTAPLECTIQQAIVTCIRANPLMSACQFQSSPPLLFLLTFIILLCLLHSVSTHRTLHSHSINLPIISSFDRP